MNLLLAWTAAALAGAVYINGTPVEPATLAGTKLENVSVHVDGVGNLHITAPGYQVQVMGQSASIANSGSHEPPGSHAQPTGVPRARWWLATEDSASSGHAIEVWINNQLAETVRSGEPLRIKDMGPMLRVGPNQVRIRSVSTNASGGTLYVFLGTGSDRSGTVHMDPPKIQFGVGASRSGEYEREYTIHVPAE